MWYVSGERDGWSVRAPDTQTLIDVSKEERWEEVELRVRLAADPQVEIKVKVSTGR